LLTSNAFESCDIDAGKETLQPPPQPFQFGLVDANRR
jgi:hypothetical protein